TDSTGFFSFSDVSPGKYMLTLQDGTGSRSHTLIVPDADVVDGSTDFGGLPVSGVVTDAEDGAPLGGSLVVLEDASGNVVASSVADAAGRFEFDEPQSAVRARAAHDGYKS